MIYNMRKMYDDLPTTKKIGYIMWINSLIKEEHIPGEDYIRNNKKVYFFPGYMVPSDMRKEVYITGSKPMKNTPGNLKKRRSSYIRKPKFNYNKGQIIYKKEDEITVLNVEDDASFIGVTVEGLKRLLRGDVNYMNGWRLKSG